MIQEIKDLMKIAINWRRGYETWLTSDGDNDYVYREFFDEIQEQLLPYVNRLVETKAISDRDASALVQFYIEQIEYLKELSDGMGKTRSGADEGGG
jgi:hypothetical protein